MRLFMRHPLLGQTAAEMSRAVIIELPRASSLRGRAGEGEGRLFSSRDTSRRCSTAKNCTELSLRDERERERELLETICHWHKFGGKGGGGLFVTTL